MKIEEYLKTSPIFSVLRAQKLIDRELKDVLHLEEVNFLQALLLITILLEGKHPISPGNLAEAFNCSKANISKMLSYLEEKNWVCRNITIEDARKYDLYLSSEGLGKANRLLKILDNLESGIELEWKAERLQGFNVQLKSLASLISKKNSSLQQF